MENDIFYLDWDGEMVLGVISKFVDEKDFLNQARQYVNTNIGYHVPLSKTNMGHISIVVNNKGDWSRDLTLFKGKELEVYTVELDWENAEK